MMLTKSEIMELITQRAEEMSFLEILDWLSTEICENNRLEIELCKLNKKLKAKDKKLNRKTKALELACEWIDKRLSWCDIDAYLPSKEDWIKQFEKDVKEMLKSEQVC